MSLTPQPGNKRLLRNLSNRHTDHTAWFHADPCRDWCCRKWSSCRAGCCWGNCGSALGHKSRCCGYIHSHRPAPPQKRLQRERQRQQQEQKRLVSRVSYESAEEKYKVAGTFARQMRKRHMHKKSSGIPIAASETERVARRDDAKRTSPKPIRQDCCGCCERFQRKDPGVFDLLGSSLSCDTTGLTPPNKHLCLRVAERFRVRRSHPIEVASSSTLGSEGTSTTALRRLS